MARFYGAIGFIETVDDGTGIWEEKTTVRYYYGDLNNNVRRWEAQNEYSANDDLSLNNNISILADAFAYSNLSAMKWVEFLGQRWKITSVELSFPRITIYFGGRWNGADETGASGSPEGYSR